MRYGQVKRAARGGFTLVEVTFALLLVVVVLGGAYGLIVHAARISRSARDHYVATNLAKNHIERARNFRYSDLYLLEESNLVLDENGGPANGGRFQRTTLVNTNYAPGLAEIVVTVQIRSRRTGEFGEEQEEISSLFTEYLEPDIE
jgi:prepilin-type N-terminal cleavage/methylation domain-containing protein